MNPIKPLKRWSLLVYMFPDQYVDNEYDWEDFDFEEWSYEKYEWESDEFNGLLDWVSEPRTTIDTGRGDCDDYALVALSWANGTGKENPGLGVCGQKIKNILPRIRHMVAFDEDNVYSSGVIYDDTSPEEYLEKSDYKWIETNELSTEELLEEI